MIFFVTSDMQSLFAEGMHVINNKEMILYPQKIVREIIELLNMSNRPNVKNVNFEYANPTMFPSRRNKRHCREKTSHLMANFSFAILVKKKSGRSMKLVTKYKSKSSIMTISLWFQQSKEM